MAVARESVLRIFIDNDLLAVAKVIVPCKRNAKISVVVGFVPARRILQGFDIRLPYRVPAIRILRRSAYVSRARAVHRSVFYPRKIHKPGNERTLFHSHFATVRHNAVGIGRNYNFAAFHCRIPNFGVGMTTENDLILRFSVSKSNRIGIERGTAPFTQGLFTNQDVIKEAEFL